MSERILSLQPPWLGKVTRTSLQGLPKGALYDSRDFVPFDCKTDRVRLSVRPGFSELGDLSNVAMLTTMPYPSDTYGVRLMAATSTTLHGWNGSAWTGSLGTLNTTSGREIHAASYGIILYLATDISAGGYDKYTAGGAVAAWSATVAGTIPQNCRLICEWGARMVLAGDPANPHVVGMSRVDDPDDWDFGETDTGAAISSPVNGAVTALIPHNRQCLIVGFHSGMQIFRGNPTNGGTLEWLSHVVGPISGKAWCKSPEDWTYFMTHEGLYKMAPGCGTAPESVSRDVIPDALIGLDGSTQKAYLVYDERWSVIHIYISGGSLAEKNWLYDVKTGGFYPITAPGSSILATYRYGPADSATASGSLIATSTGVFRLDNATALGGASAAYAKFLLPLDNLSNWSTIRRSRFVFGSNTNDTTGTVAFYGGESAYDASQAGTSRKSSHTIASIMNNHGTCFPRIGGQSALVHITQTDVTKHISLEMAALSVASTGRERG